MIYTGDRKTRPDVISFKEEFFMNEDVPVDVKVKVIYDGASGDIINQYVIFIRVCNEQVKLHGRTRKAVEETIRICQDMNVLKEYLEARKKEVIDIMVALYDEQEIIARYVTSREKESSIKTAIESFEEVGLSKDEVSQKIMNKFKLSLDEALEKIDQYWT